MPKSRCNVFATACVLVHSPFDVAMMFICSVERVRGAFKDEPDVNFYLLP